MSTFLVLRAWHGTDPAQAATQLARVFRLNPNEALDVIEQVRTGNKWKFPHPVSNQQVSIVLPFLAQLGFQAHRESQESFVRLENALPVPAESAETEVTEETIQAEETAYLRSQPSLLLEFRGDVWDLMALYLKNWMLTAVTLGIYLIKACCNVRRYLCRNTTLGGDAFVYHGRARDRLQPWLLTAAAVMLGLFLVIWIHRQDPLLSPIAQSLFILGILAALPALWTHSRRYHLRQTEWQGLRFGFSGTASQALILNLKGGLFVLASFGLYLPVFVLETAAFKRSQTTLGSRPFRFSGKWQDVGRDFTLAWGATVLTLGAALPCWLWVAGRTQRYLWQHTHFDQGQFEYTATPSQYALHQMINLCLLVVTLGLGYPWVRERNMTFITRHLSFEGLPQWPRRVQELKTSLARETVPPAIRPRLQRV